MSQKPHKFDLMNCAGWAYHSLWEHRTLLLSLAAVPLTVKILLNYIIYSYAFDENLLRQVLITLPDYFIEAWFFLGFVRFLAGRPAPFVLPFGQATGKGGTKNSTAQQNMRAGILLYVLTFLAFTAYLSALSVVLPDLDTLEQSGPDLFHTTLLMVFIFLLVRFFHILWLYIPLVAGSDMRTFAHEWNRLGSNFRLFLAWLLSSIPLTFVFFGLYGLLLEPSEGNLENATFAVKLALSLMQGLYELLIGLVQIAALYFAIFYTQDRHGI